MLLGAVLVLLLLGGAGPASAHAALGDSDPKDGAVLKSAPQHVTLTFTESVSLLDDSIRVVDPDNRPVRTGEPGRAGGRSDTVRVTLPSGLDSGTYTVAWRVVSADSHPVSGALLFSVGKPSATKAVVTTDTEDPASASLYDITRYLAYGGLALLIGVTVFTTVLGGFTTVLRKLLLGGWWALLVSTAALLLLRGPYERGTGLAEAFDPSVLRETATSRPGMALLVRLALLVGAFFLVRRTGRPGRPGRPVLIGGVALSLGLALTWAAAEHASAGIQVPLAMTSSVVHLLAMAVWLGGLTALLTVLYRTPENLSATAVALFSRLAFAAVTVLVVTGVYQSWRGLGSWDAFTSTTYGRLLIAKLGAVVLLLAAAGFSRRWTARWVTTTVRARDGERVLERERVRAEARVPERVGGGSADEPTEDPAKDPAKDPAEDPTKATATGAATADPTDEDAPTTVRATVSPMVTEADTDGEVQTRTPDGDSAPAPTHQRALRRSVLVEFTVAVVVLVITTVLTGTLPGRAATASAASAQAAAPGEPTASTSLIPFDVGTPNGHGKVQIDLAPGTVGKNSIQAVLFGPDGGIATVPELRVTFTLRAQDVGPIDAKLVNRGGYWATDTLRLPLPGTWTMKVTIRTTDIDQVTVEKNVRVVRVG